MAEGVRNPEAHLALINSGTDCDTAGEQSAVFPTGHSEAEVHHGRYVVHADRNPGRTDPGTGVAADRCRQLAWRRLAALREGSDVDYSPTFDSSPYFFNAVHIKNIVKLARDGGHGANLRAMLFLLGFMVAALILVMTTIVLPARLLNSPDGWRAEAAAVWGGRRISSPSDWDSSWWRWR